MSHSFWESGFCSDEAVLRTQAETGPALRRQAIYSPTARAANTCQPQDWQLTHRRGNLTTMSDVTQILAKIELGERHATEQLLPLVYAELRSLAAAWMASERSDHTLQPTGLVHEAYLRLVETDQPLRWDSRGHFFAAAAEAMRRILVEHARRKLGKQRGGNLQRVELNDGMAEQFENHELVVQVSDALERLQTEDAQAAELVKLHCFAGFSLPEAAEILGIANSTAYAHWAYAKALMGRLLGDA